MSNITRDNAPEYLARYAMRKAELAGRTAEERAGVAPIGEEPAFVARARDRAALRALEEMARDDGPPGRTEEFARETVAPREFQMPESFRQRVSTSVDVRLIRHGQTQGYLTDGALTPLGNWQAHRKGQDLAKGLSEGMTVKLPHAPTARAKATAEGVRSGILTALARFGIGGVTVEDPEPNAYFDNFQATCGGKEMDVTAAFMEYANTRETYQRSGSGDRPGWMVELERFFRIQFGGGDPITHWLTQPLNFVEPPVLVVRRHWLGITKLVRENGPKTKVYVCGHSGPIRAVAAAAVGHDPGEPNNTEDVRIKVYDDFEHAVVTYRNRGIEIEIPTTTVPTWISRTE
jgi:broad specificity phosphatase PhoE